MVKFDVEFDSAIRNILKPQKTMFFDDSIIIMDFQALVTEREILVAHPFSEPRSKFWSEIIKKSYFGTPTKKMLE